jgi:tetratricopeptide (TPR) repeat protein
LDQLPDLDLSRVEQQVAERIQRLVQEVERNPRSAGAWGRLGMNLHVHQLTDEAVRVYAQATTLAPRDFRWPYFSAIAYHQRGAAEAIQWYEHSLTLRADYAPLLVRYGQALAEAGRIEDAEPVLQRALALEPRSSHVLLELARLDLVQGDLEMGLTRLDRAVRLNPQLGEAHALLAEVHRRRNEPIAADRARQRSQLFANAPPLPDAVFQSVLKQGISSWWYRWRGDNLMRAGLYDEAAGEFRKALHAKPDAETHYKLGLALQYTGELDSARAHHRAALDMRPNYRQALHNLGTTLFEMGLTQEGIAYVEQARQVDPRSPEAYLRLGILHEQSGDCAVAIDELRRGMEQAQYDDRIAVRLAWLLATSSIPQLRNGPEAVRLAEGAAELTVYRDVEAMDVLAAAYARVGRFADAVEAATRAVGLAVGLQRRDLEAQLRRRVELYRAQLPLGRPGHPAIRLGAYKPSEGC